MIVPGFEGTSRDDVHSDAQEILQILEQADVIKEGCAWLAGPLATRLIGREPLITFVTFGELAKWAEIRNWGQRRREELTSWLSRIAVLPGDEAVAAAWGRLSAAAVRRGRPRPVNDMWIPACCLTHGIPLATLNLKDYEDFNQHHGLRILGRE